MTQLTDLMRRVPHSPTLWVNDLVKEKRSNGESIYHMGFGESPFPVPERLNTALAQAAHRKDYLPADGLKDLISAVKDYYTPLLGKDIIEKYDVMIAPGSKLILYALQMAVEGDLVMPTPSWVSYAPQAYMLDTNVIKVPAKLDDDGYHLDAMDLRAAIKQARADGLNPSKLILNSPNNPTGLCIPEGEMPAIAKVCREEDILIISDEIYGLVSFDGDYTSIARYAPEQTVVSTGLSKHLSLGGWRLGIGLIPKNITGLYDMLCRISSETWSCVPAPIQVAAIEAFQQHEDIEQHIRYCTAIHGQMNRYISERLKDMGITCPMAQGAFYNYPDFEAFRDVLAARGITTSVALHKTLLEKYNLATLPGEAFGDDPGHLTLRLSGCDYDGDLALKAYRDGAKLDNSFVESYAPGIVAAVNQFKQFLADIRQPLETGQEKGIATAL